MVAGNVAGITIVRSSRRVCEPLPDAGARAVGEWFPGAEVVSLGGKFTNPVVVPAEGSVDVVVDGQAGEPVEGLTTVSLTVTCDGQKVLGMPKAVVRA